MGGEYAADNREYAAFPVDQGTVAIEGQELEAGEVEHPDLV